MPFSAFILGSNVKWRARIKRHFRRVEDSVGKIRPDG